MKAILFRNSILAVALLAFTATQAQPSNTSTTKTEKVMKTYVIERNIPSVGNLTQEQLKEVSQKSCGVIKELGSGIEWVHSYVTGDKIYCIYRAESEEILREHAKKGGFPANSISEVKNVISPKTAE